MDITIPKNTYLALSTNVFYLHNTTGCGEINFFTAKGNWHGPPFSQNCDSEYSKHPDPCSDIFAKLFDLLENRSYHCRENLISLT